jgi:predicted aldo/keto reductase-like oxidoreductase
MPCPSNVDIPSVFSRYNDGAIAGKMKSQMNHLAAAGILADKPMFASQCKKCGKCEQHCPQSIKIMQELENAAKYLEPFWAKPAAKIAKKFTIGGVKRNDTQT